MGLKLVAERGCSQALPVEDFLVGQLRGWTLVGGALVGCFLCCMALSASDIYRLTVEQLRQACVESGLDSDDPVRILRRKLGEQIKREGMEPTGAQDIIQVGAPTDLLSGSVANTSSYPGEQYLRGSEAARVPFW